MKHQISIDTTEIEELLLDHLCRYYGTSSESKVLSMLLKDKLREETVKNKKDLEEFYPNKEIAIPTWEK